MGVVTMVEDGAPVQPRPAAAVMLLRDCPEQDIEVFMVRRSLQSKFMPDVYVFPGGSVSTDDRVAEETTGICKTITPAATDPAERTALGKGTRAAAIRELFEEANILLVYDHGDILAINEVSSARFETYRQAFNRRAGSLVEMAQAEQLVLATERLAYFAHWITPEGMPKRFDTHFFLALTPPEQQAAPDLFETSEGLWIQPAVALARFRDGTFPIAFPTFHQLQSLAAYRRVQDALASVTQNAIPTYLPQIGQRADRKYIYLPGDPEKSWLL